MHDKHGNEIKVGDVVKFKTWANAPPARQVDRDGVVARLFPAADTCNVQAAYFIPLVMVKPLAPGAVEQEIDPDRPILAQPMYGTLSAKECEVVVAIDGRMLVYGVPSTEAVATG